MGAFHDAPVQVHEVLRASVDRVMLAASRLNHAWNFRLENQMHRHPFPVRCHERQGGSRISFGTLRSKKTDYCSTANLDLLTHQLPGGYSIPFLKGVKKLAFTLNGFFRDILCQ